MNLRTYKFALASGTVHLVRDPDAELLVTACNGRSYVPGRLEATPFGVPTCKRCSELYRANKGAWECTADPRPSLIDAAVVDELLAPDPLDDLPPMTEEELAAHNAAVAADAKAAAATEARRRGKGTRLDDLVDAELLELGQVLEATYLGAVYGAAVVKGGLIIELIDESDARKAASPADVGDRVFATPSAAAQAIKASVGARNTAANGWTWFKNAEGRTLAELRSQLAG
jgi:hypothetical protein